MVPPKSVQESSTRGKSSASSNPVSVSSAISESAQQTEQLLTIIQTLSEKVSALETQRAEDRRVRTESMSESTELANLQRRINQLEASISSTPTGSNGSSGVSLAASLEKVKVALPDKFDGNCSNYETFKASLDNFFALKASVYSHDEVKVRTVGTLLTRQALQWYSTLVKNESVLIQDFNGFMVEFKRLFSDPNSKMKAQMMIKKLKQGNGSVLSYYTRFRAIAINTGFDQEAQISAFRNGLSDDIKDILATSLEEPNDLEALVSIAIKIDTRLYDRKMEKEARTRLPAISAVSVGPVQASELNPVQLKNGKLTKFERERRIKLKLCLYCGEAGHNLKDCPKKTNNSNTHGPDRSFIARSPVAAIAGNPSGSQQ